MIKGIAATTAIYKDYTLDEALRGIAAAGYTYVELAAMPGWCEHISPTMDEAARERVKDMLRALKLTPVAVAAHCNFLERDALDGLLATLTLAKAFGCGIVSTSPGAGPADAPQRDAALRELDAACKAQGLLLALEPHGELGSGQALKTLIERLQTRHVKINFDTANVLFFAGENPLADLKGALGELAHLHCKDKIGGQGEWNFPPVGKGELPFAAMLDVLKGSDYDGYLCVEIEYTPDAVLTLDALNADVEYSLAQLRALL